MKLTTEKLIEIKKIINLSMLCKSSGVKYSLIWQRLQRQRALKPTHIYKLTNGLKKFGIFIK